MHLQDPLPEIKRVERFLGIDSFFSKDHFFFPEESKFPCFRPSLEAEPQCMKGDKGRNLEGRVAAIAEALGLESVKQPEQQGDWSEAAWSQEWQGSRLGAQRLFGCVPLAYAHYVQFMRG